MKGFKVKVVRLDIKPIRKELDQMKLGFCETFDDCASIYLRDPNLIPPEFRGGKESQYIGMQCIKQVVKMTKKQKK